ncbi:hypothetical protein CAPTEDRAFT_154594 [Capitella teleta]|uniref:Saposin B-type domain-containing protein n=1 Tax=Capitella teleta TaxID=283909 RepID=R7VL66_CAPTE|nr:hypothetical protein CAPTEDRAFT_154594 [Capitella teleta]|eukprot:ELU17350.1 hypothetical protein CAPTEDRAFT_154594 [Capitella teleta]
MKHLQLYFSFFAVLSVVLAVEANRGINGGYYCFGCTMAVGVLQQIAEVHNASISESLESVCKYLPELSSRGTHMRRECQTLIRLLGPVLIELFYTHETPDVICHALRFCYTETGERECRLFPLPKGGIPGRLEKLRPILRKHLVKLNIPEFLEPCSWPGLKRICELADSVLDHNPAVDLDGDGFSSVEALRGSAWRGRDCSDVQKNIRPGVIPDSDKDLDANCNGIYGVDANGVPYEETLCPKNLTSRGIVVIGDSAMAHFHIPEQWVDAELFTWESFSHLPYVLENEFDWPMMSSTTGFVNITWPISPGPVHSIYLQMKERNRCVHRDYQNLAVNGADSFDTQYNQKRLSRDPVNDYPLLVLFALVGNDVCNSYPDTLSHMTTPEEMRNNVLKSLEYLNSTIPADSKVLLVGLADGRVLYDSMYQRFHPIGRHNQDITYPQFYDYFGCLQATPCQGWMTSNATLRDLTFERADKLNQVLFDVAKTYKNKFTNLEVNFLECPLMTVLEDWERVHGPGSIHQLVEAVDGFHPNQKAQSLIAQYSWKYLGKYLPHYLGDLNPHNHQIRDIFGDQGGH